MARWRENAPPLKKTSSVNGGCLIWRGEEQSIGIERSGIGNIFSHNHLYRRKRRRPRGSKAWRNKSAAAGRRNVIKHLIIGSGESGVISIMSSAHRSGGGVA